jgi:hypothetical protein
VDDVPRHVDELGRFSELTVRCVRLEALGFQKCGDLGRDLT